MKKNDAQLEGDLRPEYGLKQLRVRRLGPGREHFGEVVRLAPDVAQVVPDADSVNEALRYLIRIAKECEHAIPNPKTVVGAG